MRFFKLLAAIVTCGSLAYAQADVRPVNDPITAAEGVAADAAGNVYGAVVPAQRLQKHAKE